MQLNRHSKIILPKGQLGWLYGITLAHNNKEGFGKTGMKMPRPRLVKGYIMHSAEPQQFHSLYFGLYQRLESVESFIKTQNRNKLEVIVSKPSEWFDPQYGMTSDELIRIIETRIKDLEFDDEVFRVKKKHLPYTIKSNYRGFLENPDEYLERI